MIYMTAEGTFESSAVDAFKRTSQMLSEKAGNLKQAFSPVITIRDFGEYAESQQKEAEGKTGICINKYGTCDEEECMCHMVPEKVGQ